MTRYAASSMSHYIAKLWKISSGLCEYAVAIAAFDFVRAVKAVPDFWMAERRVPAVAAYPICVWVNDDAFWCSVVWHRGNPYIANFHMYFGKVFT